MVGEVAGRWGLFGSRSLNNEGSDRKDNIAERNPLQQLGPGDIPTWDNLSVAIEKFVQVLLIYNIYMYNVLSKSTKEFSLESSKTQD
jgi:hypothetical protein